MPVDALVLVVETDSKGGQYLTWAAQYVAILWQPAIIIKPIIAIRIMMMNPVVRSHRFKTLAIGIKHAAPMTLVTTEMTDSSECSEKPLVI